jgi:hypothetical protein
LPKICSYRSILPLSFPTPVLPSKDDRESNEPLLVKNGSAKVDRKSPEYSDNLPVKT